MAALLMKTKGWGPLSQTLIVDRRPRPTGSGPCQSDPSIGLMRPQGGIPRPWHRSTLNPNKTPGVWQSAPTCRNPTIKDELGERRSRLAGLSPDIQKSGRHWLEITGWRSQFKKTRPFCQRLVTARRWLSQSWFRSWNPIWAQWCRHRPGEPQSGIGWASCRRTGEMHHKKYSCGQTHTPASPR